MFSSLKKYRTSTTNPVATVAFAAAAVVVATALLRTNQAESPSSGKTIVVYMARSTMCICPRLLQSKIQSAPVRQNGINTKLVFEML
ncbi:hypothetical protein VFPPC_16391 [Pochonia chlamydosporia 170]|uniref:Uncharacterized protein n=1 Tax=Pochonia chlamydosporia 170 TaxID=1380566 RepID=A0A179FC64_METCM|nr:hypothetical protein VFPPC_16391 [Pochonia chlamydosporia 170]OAQ62861.1 hypothetical protein VFPPC_16391 [Pochonia chlamydosporia 170]